MRTASVLDGARVIEVLVGIDVVHGQQVRQKRNAGLNPLSLGSRLFVRHFDDLLVVIHPVQVFSENS